MATVPDRLASHSLPPPLIPLDEESQGECARNMAIVAALVLVAAFGVFAALCANGAPDSLLNPEMLGGQTNAISFAVGAFVIDVAALLYWICGSHRAIDESQNFPKAAVAEAEATVQPTVRPPPPVQEIISPPEDWAWLRSLRDPAEVSSRLCYNVQHDAWYVRRT